MEVNLDYFRSFLSLIDFQMMKRVNDDTVSDPKQGPKKHAKVENPTPMEPAADTSEPGPPPAKQYKLSKVVKPKENYQKIRSEIEPRPKEAKPQNFQNKPKFEQKPKRFEKAKGRDQREGAGFSKGMQKFARERNNQRPQRRGASDRGKPFRRG
jgi:hypothetical protein